LHICTLSFILVFLLKTHLDPFGFIPSGGSTKFQTWLVHEIHIFKLFFKINIIYFFQVIGRAINYEQHVIHSFHEMFLSHWCMTCPTKFIEISCFLRFRLNIQCFSLENIVIKPGSGVNPAKGPGFMGQPGKIKKYI
jgi:hypothetical protein